MTWRVLLVEDDLDLAQTVVDFLELESVVCDHASNGVAGLELLQQNRYDVLLLDLNLPRMGGISVCKQLRETGVDMPILMLTARDQLQDKVTGFEAGTDDYLVKPFELDELILRIKALAKRRSGQMQVLTYADIEMNLTSHTVTRQGQAIKLSPIGWRLLEQLLRAAPTILSKEKLEQGVWGDDIPDSNALKVHLYHLRKAIDAPFERPLIHTFSGHGVGLQHD